MRIVNIDLLSKSERERLLTRSTNTKSVSVEKTVKQIIERVKNGGDGAIREIVSEFSGKDTYGNTRVSTVDLRVGGKMVSTKFKNAVNQTANYIWSFQESQRPNPKRQVVTVSSGISLWRKWRPIEKVGIYVPGGQALYPSSFLMTAIPAKIAGCQTVVVCTPPDSNGEIPATLRYAAKVCGVTDIFKIGGAEAIAAMAYGTETVPKVDKVFGAGGIFTTSAKILVSRDVAIDMPAGPSENLIIADKTANPVFVAADLLTDAEHGPDSACVLITTSKSLAIEVSREIKKQLKPLATKKRISQSFQRFGFIGITESITNAIRFANDYAPEHLQLMTATPYTFARMVKNAGSVLIGPWTCKSAADYATGANHILPTGSYAKAYSGLSVEAFGKWTEFQSCTKIALKSIKDTIETFSDVEQLPAHKNSVVVRFR